MNEIYLTFLLSVENLSLTWPLENEVKGQIKKVGNLTLVLTANIPNIDILPERISEL